jgi:hypothetical protein
MTAHFNRPPAGPTNRQVGSPRLAGGPTRRGLHHLTVVIALVTFMATGCAAHPAAASGGTADSGATPASGSPTEGQLSFAGLAQRNCLWQWQQQTGLQYEQSSAGAPTNGIASKYTIDMSGSVTRADGSVTTANWTCDLNADAGVITASPKAEPVAPPQGIGAKPSGKTIGTVQLTLRNTDGYTAHLEIRWHQTQVTDASANQQFWAGCTTTPFEGASQWLSADVEATLVDTTKGGFAWSDVSKYVGLAAISTANEPSEQTIYAKNDGCVNKDDPVDPSLNWGASPWTPVQPGPARLLMTIVAPVTVTPAKPNPDPRQFDKLNAVLVTGIDESACTKPSIKSKVIVTRMVDGSNCLVGTVAARDAY